MNTKDQQNDPYAELTAEYLRSLCGGQDPHCINWTREMLPDGYRPLVVGETIQSGVDEIYYEGATPKWHKCNSPEGTPATSFMQHRRTKRPVEYRIAPDPAPAGKSDKELGEIGAKAAHHAPSPYNSPCSMLISNAGSSGSTWDIDEPKRTAFARAVREEVEKGQAEKGSTWEAAATLWESRFIEKRNEFAKQAKEIARLTAELERLRSVGEGMPSVEEMERAFCSHKGNSTEAFGIVRNLMLAAFAKQLEAEKAHTQHHIDLQLEAESEHCTLEAKLAAAEERLWELEWRPVSVKPMKVDLDSQGMVEAYEPKKGSWKCLATALEGTIATHWRRITTPPAPTAEKVSREEFEGWFQNSVLTFERNGSGEYVDPETRSLWAGWQARAAKDEKADSE